MKNLIYILLSSVLLFGVSCKKEYPYPDKDYPNIVPAAIDYTHNILPWGKFLIIDAVMYVDNHETGEKTMYHHFSPNKDTSSMRMGGSLFEIETIIKNYTTYSFWKPINYPGVGKFVLNDDTTKFYGVQYMGKNRSIIEDPTHGQQNMGGSARPFYGQTTDFDNQIVSIEIENIEGSLNGYNCSYWTLLTLKKIEEW